MSMDRELADRLAAMRDMDRPFHFSFEGPLLRRGSTRTARSRRNRREAELRPQMEAELRERGRRAFRGPVSVNIALFGRTTNAPASVKAYLDCMEGIFYADDRAVGHLYVQAFSRRSDEAAERAFIEIEPLRMYTTNYDHAYAHLGGSFGAERDLDAQEEFERDQLDGLEGELERERRRGHGLFEEIDPEFAKEVRDDRAEEIDRLRFRSLLARHLGLHDRPGPRAVGPQSASAGSDEVPVLPAGLAMALPDSVWLPLPGVPGWREQVEASLEAHMSRWSISEVPIDFALRLGPDLAVHGQRNGGKDLDNLAHIVNGAFQRVVGIEDEAPVTSYRVYVGKGARDGVKVRMVDAGLLEAVHRQVFDSKYGRTRLGGD